MRVAVYSSLPVGGAWHATNELFSALSKRHEIEVFGLAQGAAIADEAPVAYRSFPCAFRRRFDFPLSRLNWAADYANLKRLTAAQKELAREIDRGNFDVVYCPSCGITEVPLIVSYLKTPTVYHCNSREWNVHPRDARRYEQSRHPYIRRLIPDVGQKWYERSLKARRTTAMNDVVTVLGVSQFLCEQVYLQYGRRCLLSYVGLPVDRFCRISEVRRENMVLSVGALTPQKAHDLIIESLALIPRDLRPVLGIAFSSAIDKEREYLSELGQRLGVRIRWFDSVRGYDGMSELYSRAALVVATGVMEGLGRAPLEAMACETPAIAVREGGLRETIRDGVDGLLVDRDPDALAGAIESLLTDSALRERLVREGRKSVEQYWTLDRAASVLEQHLEATARRAARSTGVRQC